MKPDKSTVDRRQFVMRFMKEGGLSYSQACRVFDVMCGTLEEGIVTGSRITLGRVGALIPFWRPPRDIHMHFRKKKGGKVERGVHRTYYMDGRYEFKFRLFKRFIETHELRWFLDMPMDQA